MIASELKTGIPQKKQPTFPALYKHDDGSVYLFQNNSVAICIKAGHRNDYIGRGLTGLNAHESSHWTRLNTEEEIVLKNTD